MTAHKVAFASLVLGGSRVVTKFIDLLSGLIVARFLAPDDFGLIAIVITTLTIVRSCTDLPVSTALVHGGRLEREDLDSAFTLSLLRAVGIAALLLALARPFTILFHDPRMAPAMAVLALSPLAEGFMSPLMAAFAKDVNYTPNALVLFAGKFVGFLVTVALAWWAHSYWALVIGLAVGSVIVAIASNIAAPYRPRLSMKKASGLLHFAGWSTLSAMALTLYSQGDRFFVAGVLGKASLGFYTVGMQLAQASTWAFAGMTIPSLFSGFVQIRDDRARLKAAYAKGQSVLMAVMAPIGCAVALLAGPIVELVLGPKWLSAAPVLAVLGPIMSLQMMVVPAEALAMALGETKAIFIRNSVSLAITIPAVVVGAMAYGLTGAIIARALTCLVGIALNLMMVERFLDEPMWKQIANVWRSLAGVGAMFLVLETALRYGPSHFDGIIGFALVAGYIVLGLVAYAVAHWALWRGTGQPEGAETFALGFGARLFKSTEAEAGR